MNAQLAHHPSACDAEPLTMATAAVLRLAAEHSRTLLCRQGEYWIAAYDGTTCLLIDTRGLHYLVYLLRHPAQEIHAKQLVGAVQAVRAERPPWVDGLQRIASDLGDAGPVLDLQAAAEYRRRLDDLRAELEEAKAFNDLGRAAKASAEMAALTAELAAGARGRRVYAHAERARLAVTKGIKRALDKIRRVHPPLWRHLAATVKTGHFCSYTPDPRHPIRWEG